MTAPTNPSAPEGIQSTSSDDGWIVWAGGECPVGRDVVVDVRFRDTGEQDATHAGYWAGPSGHFDCWKHDYGNSDIIAYRLVRP